MTPDSLGSNLNTSQKPAQPLIAALYARVSTARQEQEETIESQLAEIKAQIESDGNVLSQDNVFVDDGWSGEILARPELDRMRDAAVDGRFMALYVYDRGRLSRKFAHQELVIEELVDKGVKFVTLHDAKAETPEERVLQAMQGVFHEYERIKIAERMRRGKLYKAKSGLLINGQALYGYQYVKKTDTTPTHYEIIEEEADAVRKIFYWVGIERISLFQAIRRLHDLGISPRKRKQDWWTKGPILRLLKCETYITGKVYYNKSEAIPGRRLKKDVKYFKVKKNSRKVRPREEWIPHDVPTILPDNGLFEKVAAILKFNEQFSPKNRKYNYLLSGFVWCECGRPRCGDGHKGNHYYRCAERVYTFKGEHKCKARGVNAIVMDKMFWDETVKRLTDEDFLRQQAREFIKREQSILPGNEVEERRLQTKLTQLQGEEERYARGYGSGVMSFEQFKELTTEVRKKKHAIAAQIEELKQAFDTSQITEVDIDALCAEGKRVIESVQFDDKRQLIRDIIDKIIIYNTLEVEVRAHVPAFTRNVGYEPISRDRTSYSTTLDFGFGFILPNKRRVRIITQRDDYGRIIHSTPPPLVFESPSLPSHQTLQG